MKSFLFGFILIISANQFAYTQSNKDEIEIQQAFGGNKYTIDNKRLTIKQMMKLMQNDESAYAKIKSGRALNTTATILGATGGVLIGLNVGVALAYSSDLNNETKWYMAAAGGVLVLISIPISIAGNKHTRQAVKYYNSSLNSQTLQNTKPEIRIGFTGSGIGLIIKI